MAIHSFAKSFFWESRHLVLPLTFALPAIVEVGVFAKKVYTEPEALKKRFYNVKQWVVSSFTIQPGETPKAFQQRLVKNSAKVAGYTALFACVVALPFLLFPPLLALPIALMGVYAVHKAFLYAPKILEQLKTLPKAFSLEPQGKETVQQAHERFWKNSMKAALFALLAAGAAVALSHLIPLVLGIAALVKAGGFGVWKLFPDQTPLGVFLEYAFVGILHVLSAAYSFYKGRHAQGILHILCAFFSFAFPISYLFGGIGTFPRLHHSFTGLLLMLAPLPPVQWLGGIITFDSSLYWFSSQRGFWKNEKYHNFDFMNLFVAHLGLYFCVFTVLSIFHLCVYRNNLKNREFGKEAPQNFDAERATIAEGQGASEHQNSEAKPTEPKPDSSGYFGIKEFFNDNKHS